VLDTLRRSDARYCSAACRQKGYRDRRALGLPPETGRGEIDDEHGFKQLLPVQWRVFDIRWVSYPTPVKCRLCSRVDTQTLWLGERGVLLFGPICGGECLLDTAHRRPPD